MSISRLDTGDSARHFFPRNRKFLPGTRFYVGDDLPGLFIINPPSLVLRRVNPSSLVLRRVNLVGVEDLFGDEFELFGCSFFQSAVEAGLVAGVTLA